MQIDDQVEPLVRATLDAAVKRDGERFEAALAAFPSDDALRAGLGIAGAVGAVALREMYDGEPSEEELPQAARTIAEMESWADFSASDIHTHLTGLLRGQAITGVPAAVSLAFVVTASLLASSPRVVEGEHWFNYLDRVEASIDRAAS